MTEAERVIRQHADAVLWTMLRELLEQFDEITQLAVERADTLGFAEYGDASFHKSPECLRTDRFEEYADALFYGSVERDITQRE